MNKTEKKREDFREYLRSPESGWLLIVLALAALLRVIGLGSRDFWHDEVFELVRSSHLTKMLFGSDFVSNHPPLFTGLLALWRLLPFGDAEWYVRLLPVTLGVAGVAAIYCLGRVLFDGQAGLCAAFLLAFSPFHVFHSQDLKVYILLSFTATLSVILLYLAMESNRRSHWIAYAISAGAACYSEYFVAPILLAINLWALANMKGRSDSRIPLWLFSNVAGALIFLPQLYVLLMHLDEVLVRSGSQMPEPSMMALAFYFKTVAFGYSDHDPYFKIAMVLLAIAIFAGALIGFRQRRRAVVLLGMWFVVPVATVWAASIYQNQSVFSFRAMLAFAIPLYLLAGIALSKLRPLQMQIVALSVYAVLGWTSLEDRYSDTYSLREFPHRPGIHPPSEFKEATQYIVDHWREGDTVFTTGRAAWLPCYWYGLKDKPHYFTTTDADLIEYSSSDTSEKADREILAGYYPHKTLPALAKDTNRVWLVFSEWERASLTENPMKVWRWMEAHFKQLDHRIFEGLEVFLYAREINRVPITTVYRNRDDGESALVRYQSGTEWEYINSFPDMRLTPTPFFYRVGNLVLRFIEEPNADTVSIDLSTSSNTRQVSFEILNRSVFDVECIVEFVQSDVMLDIASFEDTAPESGAWGVGGAYTRPELRLNYRLPVAMAEVGGSGKFSVVDSVWLTRGHYRGMVRVFGSSTSTTAERSRVSLFAGGVNLTENVRSEDSATLAWNWFTTPEVEVVAHKQLVELSAVATGQAQGRGAPVGLAYLGLWRAGRGVGPQADPSKPIVPWPGKTRVPNRGNKTWSAIMDADLARVDVWVYELDQNGRAYRILEQF